MDREFKEISDFSTNEELVELLFIFESQHYCLISQEFVNHKTTRGGCE